MSGNESPGDDSLSLSLSSTSTTVTTKSIASSSRDLSSIHQLDPKYKNYVSAIDKALKSFEYSSEWHDLISALSKLNKVITTWGGKYGGELPRLHLVTKRLSQCLHPNLPGGVHLKTLETYELIFKSIPADRSGSVIGPDLFSYASGLFPLWTYASEQSRPTLLRIYETYLLPLITHPALEGFLISILSGLSEDENSSATTPTIGVTDDPLSTIGRVNNLLENVTLNVGASNFNRVLWQVLKSNSKIRLAGINYVLRKSAITDDDSLAVQTLICCLVASDATNESVLIQRATLDLLLNHFPLTVLDEEKKTKLIKAALQTLLRRDMSLNRRLFSWLLGSNDPNYFESHTKSALILGCTQMFNDNGLSSSEIVRILISLLDKSEISILDEILLQIVTYFQRIQSAQCANLFFVNLKPEYVFDQLVRAIVSKSSLDLLDLDDYCHLLEYLIELDLSCFEYEKILPGVFKTLVGVSDSRNILSMKPVLMLMLKKIELDQDLFHAFIQFYLNFVGYSTSEEEGAPDSNFNFDQFLKPKLIDNFWTDFKLSRPSYEAGDIFQEKFSCLCPIELENLSEVNSLFEELLDPRILKEIPNISDWLKALLAIGCHGDIETISLLVKVVKLLEKSLCFEIVEQTYMIELSTRFLWDADQFETLSELICLNKLKVEKILLSFLKDFDSFRKLIEFLDFVGDFGDVKLLVYKLVENLDASLEQYPLEFLELREQSEEFCCKMLRENDLRFLDVFISNLLIDFESVGESLSRSRREKEKENLCLGANNKTGSGHGDTTITNNELDIDKISIGIGSASDLTSECSYRSLGDDEEEEEPEEETDGGDVKSNSTPDLTNLKLNREGENIIISRSMGDLTKISSDLDEIQHIPEIVVHDQDPQDNHGAQKDDEVDLIRSTQTSTSTAISGAVVSLMNKINSSFSALTPSTELATEVKAKSTPRQGFSKKLAHPHLKVSKDLSEDVQNRILYVLAKLEKFLTLKPDLFITYLKTCNTNQSPRINFREDIAYLELLVGKLLDFMCVVIPNDESISRMVQLSNLNVQFKSCNVLKLLLDKVLDSERMEIVSSLGFNTANGATSGGGKSGGINSTPTSSNPAVLSKRQHFSKLKRKSSTGVSSSHFVADLMTRVKVQKTLLLVLRSTTINFKQQADEAAGDVESGSSVTQGAESDFGADLSLELLRANYGQKYLTLYQGLLLSLFRTVISLESLINSVHHHYHTTSSRSISSLHRNHPSHKYLAFLPLTNQPLFHEILLTALELRDETTNSNHFNWMDLNLQILPYIINTNCPVTILTVSQICKNLQSPLPPPSGKNSQIQPAISVNKSPPNEVYILRSLDYLIAIYNAVLFRHGEKSDKPQESAQNQSSSSIYGIITSFLPGGGGSSTSPKIECVDEIDSQSKLDLLSKLDVLIKTSLAVKSPSTLNKLRNLLNPICNNYLENFLTSLSILSPAPELTELCKEVETVRVEKLTLITTRILNRNLLLFYRDFVQYIEVIEFSSGLLNSLVKECLSKSVGLMTICEVVNDLYNKFQKSDAWSKQELKELQENQFKVFDRLVSEVCNQNSYMLMDSNSVESNNSSSNGQAVNFLSGQGLQGKSYNFKRVTTSEENMEEILASLCVNLPSLIDLLWTDDKDRDKVMPMLTHLLANLIGLIKLRHTSTASYVSILKLLKNMSYYSYFRKAWKKEVFEMLLLDPTFFQMIKPHYYYVPYGWGDDDEAGNGNCKLPENQCVIQIWKVIMDNLFTQDKSSFSELLTRVSVPQTTGLNIWTSKDTEFEGRALLLKRLAFVIWSSEPDQFYKFITNIQERLAEALKTPNSPQIVPVILRSVFLCFRVLILKFTNLTALWPIIIHEIVQVLLHLEKQLMNSTKFDQDQLACALEVFKLIELLSNLPTGTLPLFQMYRWAFLPNTSVTSEENMLMENNNINHGFIPFLSRILILIEDSTTRAATPCRSSSRETSRSSLDKEKCINPSRIRVLKNLLEISGFLNGNCDNIGVEELGQELDLDFIEC